MFYSRLLITFSLFFSSFLALSETIKNIEINGLENISRGTVLSYLPFETGENIDEKELKIASKSLFDTNLFSDISIDIKDSNLILMLKENPTIKFFTFSNYEEDLVLSEELIDDIKKNFDMTNGKVFIKSNLQKLLNQLTYLYNDNGLYGTKINVKTDLDEKNRIGIDLIFNETERALIKSFNISGYKYFSKNELLDLFEIGEPDIFFINYFTEKDHFSKLKLESGISEIEQKYLNSGFMDIQVSKPRINFDKENNTLSIDIAINEGKQYKVGGISIIGNLSENQSKYLRSLILIEDGDTLDRKVLLKGINKIAEYFQNEGYAYTSVESQVNKTNEKDALFIDVIIDKNTKVFINRIVINGNTRTQDDVIRRNLKILESQIYSKKEIEDSIKSIKRLGFFSEVQYKLEPNNTEDKVNIIIDVIETKTGEVSIGLSHANSTGAAINAGISQNNILGTGNVLNAAFSNSDAVKEVSFYFKNPYFNEDGDIISYGFFDKQIDAQNLDAAAYSISESGFVLGYGFQISDISSIFAETKLSSVDLSCGSDLKKYYEVVQCSSNNKYDTKIVASFSSDTLNDFYFPTNGTKTSVVGTISAPFSDFKYYKFETNYRNYSPIFNNKTLKFSSRVNLASGYGGDELPFFKRYFEGGSSSVRGFDFNSLGAKYPNNKPKGGEFSLVSSFGIASSLDYIGLDNPNIKGIVFTDAGLISDKFSNIDFGDVRSSVGLQFSWVTPIGPLGFNIAKPIIKKSSDSTETFSFELGAKF